VAMTAVSSAKVAVMESGEVERSAIPLLTPKYYVYIEVLSTNVLVKCFVRVF
jgi:hypothetical protein